MRSCIRPSVSGSKSKPVLVATQVTCNVLDVDQGALETLRVAVQPLVVRRGVA